MDLWPEEIESLIRSLRGVTAEPFTVNLWVTDFDPGGETLQRVEYDRQMARLKPFYDELGVSLPEFKPVELPTFDVQIEALLDARPPVFSFVFGVPSPRILQTCRERGILTLGTATTVLEALALEAAGVDGIVVSGAEAGGHRTSFCARRRNLSPVPLPSYNWLRLRSRFPSWLQAGLLRDVE